VKIAGQQGRYAVGHRDGSDWLGVCGGMNHVDHQLGIGEHGDVAGVDLSDGTMLFFVFGILVSF
jgi:hypothetical protein